MKFNYLYNSFRVFSWLLWCDIRLFTKDFWNNILNALFWPMVIIIVNGYVFPVMGLPQTYGPFMTVGMLIIMASFSAWSSSTVLVADIEGARSIGYELTLPISYWLVYSKIAFSFALKAAFFNILCLVVGKILLWNQFDVSNFSISHFTLIYMAANLFFGFFAVWSACFAGTVQRHMNLEIRLAGPLFFICGHSFSWAILSGISPVMGMMMLGTPWIYAYEGTRASVLGQAGFLNYWLCIGGLILFILVFGFFGLRAFKKRLDCV